MPPSPTPVDALWTASTPFRVEGLFQRPLQSDAAQCLTCGHECYIGPGEWGHCGTRYNHAGTIYSILHGRVSSMSLNPVEKKPLYHFHPGTRALTMGSYGCNFSCPWCQNHRISQRVPVPAPDEAPFPVADFLARLERAGGHGTSMSLNEPTLFVEYALDLFPAARARGFYNTFVSNGFMTLPVVDALVAAGLDAINIDVKGTEYALLKYCGGFADKVWRAIDRFLAAGVHVELTTLVIPGVNDAEEDFSTLCETVLAHAGPTVPWHLNRFHPAWHAEDRSLTRPTPVETLETLAGFARDAGVEYVYVGNVPGHPHQHTQCPGCGARLVTRETLRRGGVRVNPHLRATGTCPDCGRDVPGHWETLD